MTISVTIGRPSRIWRIIAKLTGRTDWRGRAQAIDPCAAPNRVRTIIVEAGGAGGPGRMIGLEGWGGGKS